MRTDGISGQSSSRRLRSPSAVTCPTDARMVLVTRPLPVIQHKQAPRRWFDAGLRFTCTACGNCCSGPPGYVWITQEEIEILARHLGRAIEEVQKRYVRRIGSRYSLRERKTLDGNYDCIFLINMPDGPDGQKRRGCGIYEARPLQCRTFPFWDGIVDSRRAWESAARHCPGMDRGKHYSPRRIEALRDASRWPDEPPSSEI